MSVFVQILLFLTAVFIVLLVLVQRGRGGGLVGALGGLGGQSAFGTKAGDKVMWTTVVIAAAWILLCAASVRYFNSGTSAFESGDFGRNAPPPPAEGQLEGAPAASGGAAPSSGARDAGAAAPAAAGSTPEATPEKP